MSKAGLSILEEGLANFAKFYLEAGRERYEAGDKSQLLHCLDFCLRSDPPVPVPPWLREAFHDAYHAGASYQIKSWDEVFGRPLKKGGQLASERRKYLAKAELFETIYLSGKPLDDSLFALVGKKFGFSSTVAKELYYQALGEMRAAGLINPKKKTSGKIRISRKAPAACCAGSLNLPRKPKNFRQYLLSVFSYFCSRQTGASEWKPTNI